MDTQSDPHKLSPGALKLLLTAEQLIAEKGIDGVSSREIARSAGHKNHSAVNYNFGSFDGLVEAIIDYRVTSVNEQREQLLQAVLQVEPQPSLESLVELMIRPLANELLHGDGRSRYLNLITQLLARKHWRELFFANRARSSALTKIAALIKQQLSNHLPDAIYAERISLLGNHAIHTVAEWDAQQHHGDIRFDEDKLEWRLQNLIDYSIGGLSAPHNKRK